MHACQLSRRKPHNPSEQILSLLVQFCMHLAVNCDFFLVPLPCTERKRRPYRIAGRLPCACSTFRRILLFGCHGWLNSGQTNWPTASALQDYATRTLLRTIFFFLIKSHIYALIPLVENNTQKIETGDTNFTWKPLSKKNHDRTKAVLLYKKKFTMKLSLLIWTG